MFQLVYAHPSDQPDHFWRFANLLQADASYIDRFIAAGSGDRKYMRFAMGTSCGSQYVSLVDWQMPQPRNAYLEPTDGSPSFYAFDNDAIDEFGRPAGVDTLIYLDGLIRGRWRTDSYGGIAEELDIGDSTPGPSNTNNHGGQFAYLLGTVHGKPHRGDEALAPSTLLHEASHAIGAVSDTAPNSTDASHCYIQQDIMCYADGGPLGQSWDLRKVCIARDDVMAEPYDCSGDNYFNPNPAPGSYLATHWNLYDSAFMASCSDNKTACGTAQPPIMKAATRKALGRRLKLTLTAVTLANHTVRLTARVKRISTGAIAILCLRSRFFASGAPPCAHTWFAKGSLSVRGILQPANGEGWRFAAARAWIMKPGRPGYRAMRVKLRLP